MEKNKITDKSGDRKYFIQTPRLVWLMARDPFDLSFWNTIKDIAGEDGECRITTRELADLSMMSIGKVSACRKYWIETGLLIGQREKEPDERNAIWHLIIPDFWEKNIEAAKTYISLKSRIQFKKKQRPKIRKTVSCGEKVTVSLGEKGLSPHEKGSSPSEIATFIEEKPLEEPLEEPGEKPAPKNGAPKAPLPKDEKQEPASAPPAKYVYEWDMWTAERGEIILADVLGEKPIFDERDMNAFCKLRENGKTVAEITERFTVFCRTPDKWYIENAYAFHVFAKIFSSFSPKMRRLKENTGNGKSEKKIISAPAAKYFEPPEKKPQTEDERAAETSELLAMIRNAKANFNETNGSSTAIPEYAAV